MYNFLVYIYMLGRVKRTATSLHFIREKFRVQLYTRQMKFQCLHKAFQDEVAAMFNELFQNRKTKAGAEKLKKFREPDSNLSQILLTIYLN